jgi:hypothetical protein
MSMKHLVEFPTEDGNTILVEVEQPGDEGRVPAGKFQDIPERAQQTFEKALERIRPAAAAIYSKLKDLGDSPSDVSVEFGIKLSAKAGAVIASFDAEANLKVVIAWKQRSA